MSCVCIAILFLGIPIFATEQWDLPDTLTGSDFTNRFQVGLGFEYRNTLHATGFTELYGIRGPNVHAFLKKNIFFMYGNLEATWIWTDRSLSLSLPEMVGGVILGSWKIRGGILHSRLGTPWQEEWQPRTEWDYRSEANATSLLLFFPFSLPGIEALFHPSKAFSIGFGTYYWDFTSTDDPLFPQLTVDARYRFSELFAVQAALSSWQHGRRASSANPLLDRRTYHFYLDADLGPFSTEHFLDLYFYQEANARFNAVHSLGIRGDLLDKHLRIRGNIGLAAQNGYTNTQFAGFADLHVSVNFKYLQIYLEEHLSQSLYNFLIPTHQFTAGAEFKFPWP